MKICKMKNASWKITLTEITLLLLFSFFFGCGGGGGWGGGRLAEC